MLELGGLYQNDLFLSCDCLIVTIIKYVLSKLKPKFAANDWKKH